MKKIVGIVQLLFFCLVLLRACEANGDCKKVSCPDGEEPDVSATTFGFGLDYQCTCGKDM